MKNMVAKNAIWIIGCKLTKALLVLAVNMVTARYLGVSNYGLLSYASSLVNFLMPIMQLGLDAIIVHQLIQHRDEEGSILGTSILMNAVSSILCIAGLIGFVFFMNANEQDTLIVCAIYSTLLLFKSAEMLKYWFQSKLLSKYSSLSLVIAYAIVTFLQVLFVYFKLRVEFFAIAQVLDYVLFSSFMYIIYKRHGGTKLRFDFVIARRMISISKYYIVSNLMVMIFSQTDKIMLKQMMNNTAVGLYSAAATCAGMASFVFVAIVDSFRPTIFDQKSTEKRNKRIIELYTVIIYSSLLMSLIITLCSHWIIYIMYGESYLDAVEILQISVWFTTFSYLGTVRNVWILAENLQKYLWVINFSGAIMNIILNVVFINRFGVIGAAIASLLTQFFTNVIMGFIIPAIRPNNKLMIKSLSVMNIGSVINKMINNR